MKHKHEAIQWRIWTHSLRNALCHSKYYL